MCGDRALEASSAIGGGDAKHAPVAIPKRPESALKSAARAAVARLIALLGAPTEELNAPWVRRLCMLNGFLALVQFQGEVRDRMLFKTPRGDTKVASYSVMNFKYTGLFKAILFTHILSGSIAQLGSSLAIAFEEYRPQLSRKIAKVSAFAETFFHAPTAFAMTPWVYGDKGITVPVYGLVSFLLLLSGASALFEASDDEVAEGGKGKRQRRPELRRMCATISIFLYVRLFALMRGAGGMLQRQKYSLAVMTAGSAMMPVGWQRFAFPGYFWVLMALNRQTLGQTLQLIGDFGVDGAATRQMHLV